MGLSLLNDLKAAEAESLGQKPCGICAYVADDTVDPEIRAAVERAAANGGKIGLKKLAAIFRVHEVPAGYRTIKRHRDEGHLL